MIAELKAALGPSIPVLIGGRVTEQNIRSVRQGADGAIVATSIRTGTEFVGPHRCHQSLAVGARIAWICTKT